MLDKPQSAEPIGRRSKSVRRLSPLNKDLEGPLKDITDSTQPSIGIAKSIKSTRPPLATQSVQNKLPPSGR